MEAKRTLIRTCAKELFSQKGFKQTSVADITQCAQVAVGTFYSYYSSKEKLFMELFLEENAQLKHTCLAALDLSQSPQQVVMTMLRVNAEGFRTNPILSEWYNRKVFRRIERVYREEHGIEAVDFLYDTFLDLVKTWQAAGVMRADIDSRTIMLVFSAIITVDVHKEDVGVEHFPELLTVMTELVMRGLEVRPD